MIALEKCSLLVLDRLGCTSECWWNRKKRGGGECGEGQTPCPPSGFATDVIFYVALTATTTCSPGCGLFLFSSTPPHETGDMSHEN